MEQLILLEETAYFNESLQHVHQFALLKELLRLKKVKYMFERSLKD